jgi:hypothetical protein
MNAILPHVAQLMMPAYLALLVSNIVGLIVIYAAQRRRWARWLLYVFPGMNTPHVLYFIGAIAHEERATRGQRQGEGGMVLGILIAIALPLMLEFLLLLSAWSRLRAHAKRQSPER